MLTGARHGARALAMASSDLVVRDGSCCAPSGPLHLRSVRLHDVDGPEGEAWCAAECAAEPLCRFFAFRGARSPNGCDLCTGCSLSPSAFTRSWPRGWQGCAKQSIPAVIGGLLGEHLQGAYSRHIYGRPGMVHLRELRVLFADLLPRAAVRALAGAGVCKAEASPPFHPFYWGHDLYANPRNSIWIHRTEGPQAVANGSWVEITHCALSNGMRGGSAYPLWTYAAAGSGVSLNVGRTMIANSYNHATGLLRQAFPKVRRGDGGGGLLTDAEAAEALNRSPLAELDSLQIINHREFHSIEARHEIVFLRRHEHEKFTARSPGVKCGRHPHLRACDDQDLSRMANCSSRPSATSDASHWLHSEANVRKVFSSQRRCNVSHVAAPSHCYSEHVERWGDYHCCGTTTRTTLAYEFSSSG